MPRKIFKPLPSRATLALLIDQAKQNLEDTVTYTASWLKEGGIGSPEWKVIGNKNKFVTVSFSELLSDGSLLTDPPNALLLATIQKQVFCIRARYLTPRVDHLTWMKYVRFYINLASWLCLYKDQYHPQTFGFKLLNKNACELLVNDYCTSGWAGALQLIPRLSEIFCEQIGEVYNGVELTQSQIATIVEHLKKNNLYTKNKIDTEHEFGLVSRTYLATILNTHITAFKHVHTRTFLRQFEVNLQKPVLVHGINIRAQYSSHKAPIFDTDASGEITKASLVQFLILVKSVAEGNPYLPDLMPRFEYNPSEELKNYDVKKEGHTRKIPYSIGMYALDKAIEWVMVYGKAIVGASIEIIKAFHDIAPGELKKTRDRYRQRQKIFETIISSYTTESFEGLPAQPLTLAINIQRLTSQSPKTSSSKNMTFAVALECFVAACALILGFTKPLRIDELSQISRKSLSYQTNEEGAFLRHPVLKKRVPIPPTIRRPIPFIASLAVQLLNVLGNGLKEVYQDTSPHSEQLFYFPSSKGFNKPSGRRLGIRIDSAIRSFCDIIDIPVDIYGRRWYIKIHEMRKFFIVTMYNHSQVYSDDSIRHQAGHDDPRYFHEYLGGDIPEEEILKYNIENIEDKLADLEAGNISEVENQGLVALYKKILSTLNITSLKSRNKYEFDQFLQALLASDGLLISTYTVRLTTYESEVYDTDIALKYGESKDENFNR